MSAYLAFIRQAEEEIGIPPYGPGPGLSLPVCASCGVLNFAAYIKHLDRCAWKQRVQARAYELAAENALTETT